MSTTETPTPLFEPTAAVAATPEGAVMLGVGDVARHGGTLYTVLALPEGHPGDPEMLPDGLLGVRIGARSHLGVLTRLRHDPRIPGYWVHTDRFPYGIDLAYGTPVLVEISAEDLAELRHRHATPR